MAIKFKATVSDTSPWLGAYGPYTRRQIGKVLSVALRDYREGIYEVNPELFRPFPKGQGIPLLFSASEASNTRAHYVMGSILSEIQSRYGLVNVLTRNDIASFIIQDVYAAAQERFSPVVGGLLLPGATDVSIISVDIFPDQSDTAHGINLDGDTPAGGDDDDWWAGPKITSGPRTK